jgi:cold shock protein
MRTGTLKWFDEVKGYGYIVPTDGGEDIFVRKSAFEQAGFGASEGQTLAFEVSRETDGLQAIQLSAG